MNGSIQAGYSSPNGAELAELQTKFRSARKALPQQLNLLKGEDLVDALTNKFLFRALELGRRIIEKSEELRKKTLDILWLECIYPTVTRIRRCKPDDDIRAAVGMFTNAMVGFLQDFAMLYPELTFSVLCYCGDLSRYRAIYAGPQDYYTKVAEQRYMAALMTHQAESTIYNRLGVLYQKDDVFKSLFCFAHAITDKHPFDGALSNIKNIDEEKIPAVAQNGLLKLTVGLAQGFLSSQGFSVDVRCREWEHFLKEDSIETVMKGVRVSTLISLFLSSKGDQESLRQCIASCHSLWDLVVEKLSSSEDDISELEMELRRKKVRGRRRHDSDSEEDKSSDGEKKSINIDKMRTGVINRLCEAATSLSHWIVRVSEDIADNNVKLSLFTQEQLNSMIRGLTELVNPVISQLRPYLDGESMTDFVPEPFFVDIEGRPGHMFKCLAYYVRKCVSMDEIPLVLNRYLEFFTGRKAVNEMMKSMAKVRLESEQRSEDEKARFPVYVLPDLQVLQSKLYHMKRLLRCENAPQIVIGESILATLDKNKKGCANIREAIRWIENILEDNRGIIKHMDHGSSIMKCAESLIPSGQSLSGLFATVLVCGAEQEMETSQYGSISVETVDSFSARWAEAMKFEEKTKTKKFRNSRT
ncbi:hypothetical protein QR680_009134 [Steinernema hermaphroditum]|uniref:Uncharacterized protein n=1 Tax=Steinernema hermaphroditum TaxID=289476 RepID=A0AA39IL99_9BILA|nr:hypothetical protein QR680_009134 [Steinernema hermaphroditum]